MRRGCVLAGAGLGCIPTHSFNLGLEKLHGALERHSSHQCPSARAQKGISGGDCRQDEGNARLHCESQGWARREERASFTAQLQLDSALESRVTTSDDGARQGLDHFGRINFNRPVWQDGKK